MVHVDACNWVALIAADEIRLAAQLRSMRGVEVLVLDGQIWLRGTLQCGTPLRIVSSVTDDVERQLLRLLPGVRPYHVADGQLTRVGDRVPSATMPRGPWQPLADWLEISLPPVVEGRPGPRRQVALTLARSTEERIPTLLLTSFGLWRDYCATAPQWRLERLVFAVDSSHRVLLRGTPLPPLPGERWVEQDGIATLAGWTWKPAIQVDSLRAKFGVERKDLVLLQDKQWQVVHAADWVRATRTAVRSTAGVAYDP